MHETARSTPCTERLTEDMSPVRLFYVCFSFQDAAEPLRRLLASSSIREADILCTPEEKDTVSRFISDIRSDTSVSLHVSRDIADWYGDATEILLSHAQSLPYLLFLTSDIVLQGDSPDGYLPVLQDELKTADPSVHILGVSPVLLARVDTTDVIVSLGPAVDSRGFLHALHEGMEPAPELLARRRFFRYGLFDAMLLRLQDFLESGGFDPYYSRISPCILSGHMRETIPGGVFTVSTTVTAYQRNPLAAWDTFGLWNSMCLHGRIRPDRTADYPTLLRQDGFTYGITAWLSEGPKEEKRADHVPLPFFPSYHDPVRFCRMLAQYLQHPSDRWSRGSSGILQRISEVGYFLPQPMSYYESCARQLLRLAKKEGLVHLDEQIRHWNRNREEVHALLRKTLRFMVDSHLATAGINLLPASYTAFLELAEPGQIARAQERSGNSREDASHEATAAPGSDPYPRISLIVPVYNPDHQFLREMIRSIRNQTYGNWQLCMADDCSTDPRIRSLLESCARQDPRITVLFREQNGHIPEASNSALTLARGDFVGFVDQDDLLPPYALELCAAAVAEHPGCRFFFSDEDQISADGVRKNPVFRSRFTLDNVIPGHLMLFRKDCVDAVHGFRKGTEGAQDRDLVLRIAEGLTPEQIHHIPHILYHWRIHAGSTSSSIRTKPYVLTAGAEVVKESYARRGIPVRVVKAERNNFFRISVQTPPPSVGLLLLERNGSLPVDQGLLAQIASFADAVTDCTLLPEDATGTPHGDSVHRDTLRALESLFRERFRVHAGDQSDASLGVCAENSRGSVLLMLGTDLVPLKDTDAGQLIRWAALPHAGMVGSMLYRHGRLWHGGLFPDADGTVFPLLQGTPRADFPSLPCSFPTFLEQHLTVGCHRAALALRKDLFLKTGGFDTAAGPLAEVCTCLRLEELGYENSISVWSQWEVRKAEEDVFLPETPWSVYLREHFGHRISTHPLRNPCLRMARSRDWQYLL